MLWLGKGELDEDIRGRRTPVHFTMIARCRGVLPASFSTAGLFPYIYTIHHCCSFLSLSVSLSHTHSPTPTSTHRHTQAQSLTLLPFASRLLPECGTMTSLSISTPPRPPSPYPSPLPPPPPAAATLSHHVQKWFPSSIVPVRALFSNSGDISSSSQSSSLSHGKEGRNGDMIAVPTHPLNSMDHFNDEIAGAHTSIYLLISFFNSGLVDSVVFNSWSCFVGMQTGERHRQVTAAD